jgi:hypothetical protein
MLAVRSEAQTEGIIFHVFDKKGENARPLKWDDFRKRQEDEAGDKGDNDALFDPSDLTTLLNREGVPYGLYPLDGLPTIDWPADKAGETVTLIIAWPTAVGYSNLLQEVDEWEVGNEVKGEWLLKPQEKVEKSGESCDSCTGYAARADYIAYAADYVKNHSGKRTLLTLYWQVAEDKPSSSMFNWVRNVLTPAITSEHTPVKDLIDDVGISLYPDKAPMGLAFDRVFSTLREKHFGRDGQRIMVTELGYWPAKSTEAGYEHIWRWGGPDLK